MLLVFTQLCSWMPNLKLAPQLSRMSKAKIFNQILAPSQPTVETRLCCQLIEPIFDCRAPHFEPRVMHYFLGSVKDAPYKSTIKQPMIHPEVCYPNFTTFTGHSISFDMKGTFIVLKLFDISVWFFFLIKALCMTFFVSNFHRGGSWNSAEIHVWSYAVNSTNKVVFSQILT